MKEMHVELEEIDKNEFKTFVESDMFGNFLQSPEIGTRRLRDGWQPHLIGIKQNHKVVAVALLSSKKILGKSRLFECQRGPLLDYDNIALFEQVLKELKMYVRQHHGVRLCVDPPVLMRHRDKYARVVKDDYKGEKYLDVFMRQSFIQMSSAAVDKNQNLLRWFFVRDLSGLATYDDFLTTIESKHRSVLAAVRRSGVTVKRVSNDQEFEQFFGILSKTGNRRGFAVRNEDYYCSMAKEFSRESLWYMIATILPSTYRNSINTDIATISKSIELCRVACENDPTKERQLKDLEMRRASYERRLALSNKIFKNTSDDTPVPLAAAMFVHYGPELVYLNSGSDERYSSLNAPYALQEWAIRHAIEEKIPRYNFYGTHGVFDGHPEQEGVYKFKRGFNGVVEERLGYFCYTPSAIRYNVVRLLDGIRRRVKSLLT